MGNPVKPPQPTLSTYRPGVMEGVLDATLGAAMRQLERFGGASEREAYSRGRHAVDGVEALTGWQAAERSGKSIARGQGFASDYVNVGVAALPVIGSRVAKGMIKAAGAVTPPSVVNRLYSSSIARPDLNPLGELPKYAFRNVSGPGEIDDILASGYMRARPGARNANKYFSMMDEPMGNPNNVRGSKPVLRVESQNIPIGSPVRAQHVETWSPFADAWVKLTGQK